MIDYDKLPNAPIGEPLETDYFFAQTVLSGDADELAKEMALIMRANNRVNTVSRKALLAPAGWELQEGGVKFSLAGKAYSGCFTERWKDDSSWGRSTEQNTSYRVQCFLQENFREEFEVRPLSLSNKEDLPLIDALGALTRHWNLDGYPSVDDVVSAGNQKDSILGNQGAYAASSPYFSATLVTKSVFDELNCSALSAASKMLLRTTGVKIAPHVVFQREDGRFELRIVGCCFYTPESRLLRAAASNVPVSATSAVIDPIEHYLDVEVEKLHIFKTTAEHYEDIVTSEKVADELELLGVPEPEDFIVVPREKVRADDEARAQGEKSTLAEPELKGEEELAKLIGLAEAKRQISEFVDFASIQRMRGQDVPHLHSCFMGNPGTGKTTLARIFGHMLYDAGLLPKRNVFVETSGVDFSHFTAQAYIQRARRGVLFIDEAYTLSYDALAILVKAMEDCHQNFRRDGFIVVLAGYPREMEAMISKNPGLRDRIGAFIDFEDYAADELFAIFIKLLSEGDYGIDHDAIDAIQERLRQIELLKDANFANARLVRKIFERIQMRQATLYGPDPNIHAAVIEDVFKDEFADLVGERRRSEAARETPEELSGDEQLARLIGLEKTKDQICEFLDYAAVQKERGGRMPSLHMCFKGNPGTGKTTLARIVGRMMYDRGLLLRKNAFVEGDRESFVGGFVGHTAMKTKAKIAEARHGVLFIDEAYALDGGHDNDFGKEALSTLVKAMEDSLENFERDGFVCIMAGYPELMDKMISINPGLRDRFGLTVDFEDYNSDELMEVFELLAKDEKYKLTKDARVYLKAKVECLVDSKDTDFSNARLMRKLFERAKMRQARLHGTNSWFKVDVFEQVFAEPDIAELIEGGKGKNNIGFVA